MVLMMVVCSKMQLRQKEVQYRDFVGWFDFLMGQKFKSEDLATFDRFWPSFFQIPAHFALFARRCKKCQVDVTDRNKTFQVEVEVCYSTLVSKQCVAQRLVQVQ